jgi:putative molybdopterin biosynthesis protein
MYLKDIPLPEAKTRFEAALLEADLWGVLGVEEIPLDYQAGSRVLAEAIWAKISSPHYHAAAMDGFAVQAVDTDGAMTTHPLKLQVGRNAIYVDTGSPLPETCDAVIPIEFVEALDEQEQPARDVRAASWIRIRAAVTPWSNVRPMGEDIVSSELVLPAGHVLRPVDLGAIAASGGKVLRVARKPRVALIPTGSELVPAGGEVKPGEIIEYNSLVLAAQVASWGGEPIRYPIVPDDFNAIREKVSEAATTADLVLLLSGSSAGSRDFSARVVEALGEVHVHGIAVRPGHPVILGMLNKSVHQSKPTPVIGVPGFPVSAALTGEIFVEPILSRWLGRRPESRPVVKARLTRKITSPPGDDDFVRVVVGRIGQEVLAAPLARGAGVITSLVRADGITVLPRGVQGLAAGEEVQVQLYRPLEEIDRTIFMIGSHDMALDVLAEHIARRERRLVSANVGSIGGLVALRRGEAHLSGTHLLDPETGVYNVTYLRQYLPGVGVKLVGMVGRQQGLIVPKGNPKAIRSLEDLTREDVIFVNRQRGAGTRVLLDYHLGRMNIAPEQIRGYTHEEFTHLAVAASVASGRADCGLGIAAAARALGLEFINLFEERYELAIPEEHFFSELLAPLLQLLNDSGFQQEIARLPGYEVSQMGIITAELH